MRCVLINLSCYLPTFCSITSGPKCQSSNQNGQIISYPCKDFQMYFYFSLFVKLQCNVTGKLPLFSVIWRFLRLAPLAGAKNFFLYRVIHFWKAHTISNQMPCSGDMWLKKARKKMCLLRVQIRMSTIRPRNQIVMANCFSYYNCIKKIFYRYRGTDKSSKNIPVLWAYLIGKAKINP